MKWTLAVRKMLIIDLLDVDWFVATQLQFVKNTMSVKRNETRYARVWFQNLTFPSDAAIVKNQRVVTAINGFHNFSSFELKSSIYNFESEYRGWGLLWTEWVNEVLMVGISHNLN